MALKFLAIESLELSILAGLNRQANRLRYADLLLTTDCSYSKDYQQPNCSAYNREFKMASKIFGHREPRTINFNNVNTTL